MDHNIGSGDVEIELADKGKFNLKPTLGAAIKLSGVQGGLTRMVERCLSLEFDAILTVVVNGLGSNSKDLPDLIYKTGLLNLSDPCIKFLHILANGGRPLSIEGENKEEAPLESNSP